MNDLPHGWERTTLGDIGQYLNGRGFRKHEWSDLGRPIIRIQNLTGTSSRFNYFSGDAEESYTARRGDLLISWAATLGAFVWDGPEAVVNQHIFKVKSFIDKRFHRYLVTSVLDELQRQAHGSGMVHVTRKVFDEIPVALPPLAEQRRIVAAIEEHLSRLNEAHASSERAATRTYLLRQAVLETTFTTSWPLVTLGKVASLSDGPFGSNLKTSHYVSSGPRVVRLQNIGDGVFRDERAHITPRHFATLSKHEVIPGDIVAASLGEEAPRACLIPEWLGPAVVKADCIRVRPSAKVNGTYLMWALNSPPVKRQAAERIKGIGRPRLGLGGLRELEIPLPPLDEQVRLAFKLEEQLSLVGSLVTTLESTRTRSALLRRAVLTQAFRGELVPQDRSDEPASTLLARIAAGRAAAPKPTRKRKETTAA